jgi:hypothetical protein
MEKSVTDAEANATAGLSSTLPTLIVRIPHFFSLRNKAVHFSSPGILNADVSDRFFPTNNMDVNRQINRTKPDVHPKGKPVNQLEKKGHPKHLQMHSRRIHRHIGCSLIPRSSKPEANCQ